MSADTKLKAYIDRVLSSREREDAEKANTKQIYAELAGEGYDKTIVGKVVNHLRKDQDKVREQSELFDTYLAAYFGASHVHARVREAAKPAGNGASGAEEETQVANSRASSSANSSRLDGSSAAPGLGTPLAGAGSEADRQPIPPPAEGNTPTSAGHGDRRADTSPAATVVADNVLQLRTHNPETHFLNSAGLVRLHGCLKPENCGSSEPRKRLCFTCSVQHDGPTFQDGVA